LTNLSKNARCRSGGHGRKPGNTVKEIRRKASKTAPAYSKGAFAKYLPLRKTAKDQDSIINCRSFSDARPRSKKLLQHQ
jgi:hypothetical protein